MDYADEEELALAGIQALEDFIRECGLPGTLRELGVDESTDLREIADSCYTAGAPSGKSGRMKYMRFIRNVSRKRERREESDSLGESLFLYKENSANSR